MNNDQNTSPSPEVSSTPLVTPKENEAPREQNPSVKGDKPWLIIGLAFGLLLLITIIAVTTTIMVLQRNQTAPSPQKPPPVSEPPASLPVVPTKYSTDPAILKLRDDLKTLTGKTDSVDFIEPEIAPPDLDLNLNIQPKQ